MVSTNFAAPSTHNRDVIKMTIPAVTRMSKSTEEATCDTNWLSTEPNTPDISQDRSRLIHKLIM